MKMILGSAALKMNGNLAISLHRPGVVGTAYTTVTFAATGAACGTASCQIVAEASSTSVAASAFAREAATGPAT